MNGNLQAALFSVLRKSDFNIFFLPQSDSFLVIAKYIVNIKLWRIPTWSSANSCDVAHRLLIISLSWVRRLSISADRRLDKPIEDCQIRLGTVGTSKATHDEVLYPLLCVNALALPDL